MLSQSFEHWLKCQDQLNACSDKWHDSHSGILPLSEPSSMLAEYQHIFSLLEADSELSGMCYGKTSPYSSSVIVTESNIISLTRLMQNGY